MEPLNENRLRTDLVDVINGPLDSWWDKLRPLLLSDLSVKIHEPNNPQAQSCRKVTFRIDLTAGLTARLSPPRILPVEVRVTTNWKNQPDANLVVYFASTGGSIYQRVEFPTPPADSGDNIQTRFQIEVDPDHKIAERYEGSNNVTTFIGECIG